MPFQRTTELPIKPEPVTVRVKAPLPAMAALGLMDAMEGAGLGATIVNEIEFDMPPPGEGLDTVTGIDPAEAISLAGIAAVN